ncbi:unnamed protein product [Allacma fusca]|uniref:Uncharacterized protein n=1 Tax=Allacma fusca TaxID=39272 RepID=A0A8J2PEU1_9HEXA|nr:unnamed protein product [Allacma fusca]
MPEKFSLIPSYFIQGGDANIRFNLRTVIAYKWKMDTVTPEAKQSLLVDMFAVCFDDVQEIADLSALQWEIVDLENKLGDVCAVPSLKIQVIQNAKSHEEFARFGSQESNVDENLQTEEENSIENLLIHSNKDERKRKAELNQLEKDFLNLDGLLNEIRALGPVQIPTEPRDTTRKHQLQKENVRLANILVVMSATRQLDYRRQKKIERLCEIVHTKNYNLEAPDADI